MQRGPILQPVREAIVLEVSLTAPSPEPPLAPSAHSGRRPQSPEEAQGQRWAHWQVSQSGNSCSHTIGQEDEPEQPKAIQSPELLMATDSIL